MYNSTTVSGNWFEEQWGKKVVLLDSILSLEKLTFWFFYLSHNTHALQILGIKSS